MKKLIHLCLIVAAAAVGQRADAATYTNYLDDASNAIAQAYSATEGKTQARLGKALKAFNKESASVADDYGIFFSISTQLLPLLGTPGTEVISATLSNAFNSFVIEGMTQIAVLNARLEAITPFQGLRKAASNQVAQAERAIIKPTQTTNIQEGILSVRLAFVKIGVADKLLTKAEAKPGYAPDSLVGFTLTHTEPGDTGTLTFTDETTYTDEGSGGTYTYTRTGLSTGLLIVTENEPDGGVTTVALKFSSATSGKFSYHFESPGDSGHGSGSFTLAN